MVDRRDPDAGTPPVPTRRRDAVVAGHTGDEVTARRALEDPDASVRAAGIGALARLGRLTDTELLDALSDPEPGVRRRALEALTASDASAAAPDVFRGVIDRLEDPDATVVVAAAGALGEQLAATTGDDAARAGALTALAAMAQGHDDSLCREAAVAALGAIGDRAGLPAVLHACGDVVAVRRRAVLALAAFDGAEVDEALAQAAGDRDWLVRQAAEDLLGR